MNAALSCASSLVRAWTALYTWRLPGAMRKARRAEIESALWEFQADANAGRGLHPALHTLIRLLMGIPDDLRWRAENAGPARAPARRLVVAAAGAVLLGAVWVFAAFQDARVPQVAAAPPDWYHVSFKPLPPPPPPPPPPPRPCADWDGRVGCSR